MKKLHVILCVNFLLCLTIAGCKKENEGPERWNADPEEYEPVKNTAPVAKAGNDTIIYLPNNRARLDASGSSDPDGDELKYSWKCTNCGSNTMIHSPEDSSTGVFGMITKGVYEFELTVRDKKNGLSHDKIIITVEDPECSTPLHELIVEGLPWITEEAWGTTAIYINLDSVLPANSYFKEAFLTTGSAKEWKPVAVSTFWSDYTNYSYSYSEGMLYVYPPNAPLLDSTADVKLVYCN